MNPKDLKQPLHGYSAYLTLLLQQNPQLNGAWLNQTVNPAQLHLTQQSDTAHFHLNEITPLAHFTKIVHVEEPFRTLEAPLTSTNLAYPNQRCQNEPIRLGTQIQPAHSAWVGTAGAPVRWPDRKGQQRWGILSNWHVMDAGKRKTRITIHQPTDDRSPIAILTEASPVHPRKPNLIDAAIADARIDGKHTIHNSILGIQTRHSTPITATEGMKIIKSGRTTGVTVGKCIAVGASVRVNYQNFIALFQDQDIYEGIDQDFSAPGDSGSLILSYQQNAPVSLLFAGNDEITIGNRFAHVAKYFNLQHPFTQE